MTTQLNILIACEESQAETMAFRALGHNAFSCDIQPCRRGTPECWHIIQDVTPLLQGATRFTTQDRVDNQVSHWDLIIAHPPCTYLCKVGSVWLYKHPDEWRRRNQDLIFVNADRWNRMNMAAEFFRKCLDAQAPYVAVENPIPMRWAGLPKPSCYLHPSWFGVKYTKKTLYWLKNLPPIMPEIIFPKPKCFVTSSRGKYRSRTFPQVAAAIARQWSTYIINDKIQQHGKVF